MFKWSNKLFGLEVEVEVGSLKKKRINRTWTDVEKQTIEEFLDMPSKELHKQFFPYRTLKSVESMRSRIKKAKKEIK